MNYTPHELVHFKPNNFFKTFLAPPLLISICWLIFIGLNILGLPLPDIKIEKFFDLGFFSISMFGLIVFLTMAPFQSVEGKLSPIFYSKIYKNPSAHFGLYVLMLVSITCFLVITLRQAIDINTYLSELFIALVTSIIFAILFHRFWVLRCLYQPYIVYQYIGTVEQNISDKEIWLELFECTFKAIKQGRLADSRYFIELMAIIYDKHFSLADKAILNEDIMSLHTVSQECRPVARFIEKKWPLCLQKK